MHRFRDENCSNVEGNDMLAWKREQEENAIVATKRNSLVTLDARTEREDADSSCTLDEWWLRLMR